MNTPIRLIALDLDGTLFNSRGEITAETKNEIRRVTSEGVCVALSTGRPYNGLPFNQIQGLGIDYAITTNGAALYRISDNTCLFEEGMDFETISPILSFLLTKEIHIDAYIGGREYTLERCLQELDRLPFTENMKAYIRASRTAVRDLYSYVRDCGQTIQKMTLNFYPQPDGTRLCREEVRRFLESAPSIETVCGGFCNLEFCKAGINKGVGLLRLASLLGIAQEETMAIGDSGNDASILQTAAIGVAMANASEDILSIADHITASNDEDGVAKAILTFLPK